MRPLWRIIDDTENMRPILIALFILPIAYAQSTMVSVNMNGNFTFNQVANVQNLQGSGSGNMSPFGAGAVNVSYSIVTARNSNTLSGTFTFSFPSMGSFTASYTTVYQNGAQSLNLNCTVTGGTGIFANASGTLQLLYEFSSAGQSGIFTLTGTGTLLLVSPGTIQVSPTSLTFNAISSGELPPSQSASVVAATGGQSAFTFTIDGGSTGTTAPWLSALPAAGGATPGRLIVTVDPAQVQGSATSFKGRIRVLGSGAGATPQDVTVTLNIVVAKPGLSTSPGSMRFSKVNPQQLLALHNSGGGGPLNFTATVNGSNSFIASVTPSSGQTPAALTVRVNIGAPGAFRDSIHIATTNAGNVDVPVSLFVPSPGPVLAVAQTGFRFQTVQGLGTSTTQTIRILNVGDTGTKVNWTAALITGSEWLSLNSTTGTATPAASSTLVLRTGPGAATQTPGGHYALIRISAAGAQNSPQYVAGVLDVAAAGAATAPDPNSGGLFFAGAALGIQPVSQSLVIGTSSATAAKVAVSTATTDGTNWLSVSAVNDAASSAQTAQFTVSASATGLKAGIYTGEIDVAIQNVLRAVNVTLAVAPAGTTFAAANGPREATGCAASRLAVTQTGLVNNFSVPAGWPATLEVQLNDDCGPPVTNGTLVASFSNGDPPITLLGDGQSAFYSATWQPGSAGSSVAVTLNANAPGLSPVTIQINGGVNANGTPAPSLVIDGLLHNLNPIVGAPLAPGTVAQVYGTNLTTSPDSPSSVPLPSLFKGVQVLIGGLAAPLYYIGPTQLTVQIPSELTATNEYQALIAVNDAYSLPQPVDLVPVAPGVVAFPDGSLVAQHSADFSLVDATKPAKPGEALVIYLVGLGATSVNVPSGTAAPGNPLANVSNPVTVTIDGQPVQTLFVGLTPGGVGLYQINLTVPANARAGKVPVVITQSGIAANATTLLVQP